MAHNGKITTSVHGRRLGLERQSTAVSGGSLGDNEYLVGPEAIRLGVTAAETTSANLQPHGISKLVSSSVGSSQVYTIDPPVPGVDKMIVNSTDATAFLKLGGATVVSTKNSTGEVIEFPAGGAALKLTGFTTAQWLMFQSTAAGFAITATT